jgi:hypothetical protein
VVAVVVTMVIHEGWVVLAVVAMVRQLMEELLRVLELQTLVVAVVVAVKHQLHRQTEHRVVLEL